MGGMITLLELWKLVAGIYIYTIMSIINKDAFFGYSFDFVLEIPPPSLGFAIYCNVNSYISI